MTCMTDGAGTPAAATYNIALRTSVRLSEPGNPKGPMTFRIWKPEKYDATMGIGNSGHSVLGPQEARNLSSSQPEPSSNGQINQGLVARVTRALLYRHTAKLVVSIFAISFLYYKACNYLSPSSDCKFGTSILLNIAIFLVLAGGTYDKTLQKRAQRARREGQS
ncbi:hypothetical protein M432DRAFT_592216 [Thermoascus aurantiacus ATCC 26904]